MNKRLTNKKILLCTSALIGAASLAGCGNTSEEEKALAAFSSSVSAFADNLLAADTKINTLDPGNRESVGELLETLDQMEEEFATFSTIQVPAQYESVSGFAARASEAMSLAASYYHTAYESEVFDQNSADAAYQCYTFSMDVVGYIGMLILGEEIPEDINAGITVHQIPSDEHLLNKLLYGEQEEEDIPTENETAPDGISETVN